MPHPNQLPTDPPHPSQTKPSAAATLAPWGRRHHNRLTLGSRTGAEHGPVWTCPHTESAAQHLRVVPCAGGLWSRQRWLCSPASCSEPGGAAGQPHPAHPLHTHRHRCLGSLPYSLHSVAIPKHDVVSEGAVDVQIYLFDFRRKALCLFFHLLEGRGADKRKESDTISAHASLGAARAQPERQLRSCTELSQSDSGTLMPGSEQRSAARR